MICPLRTPIDVRAVVREPDVGIRAAELLRFAKRDRGRPLAISRSRTAGVCSRVRIEHARKRPPRQAGHDSARGEGLEESAARDSWDYQIT